MFESFKKAGDHWKQTIFKISYGYPHHPASTPHCAPTLYSVVETKSKKLNFFFLFGIETTIKRSVRESNGCAVYVHNNTSRRCGVYNYMLPPKVKKARRKHHKKESRITIMPVVNSLLFRRCWTELVYISCLLVVIQFVVMLFFVALMSVMMLRSLFSFQV